MHPSRRRGGRGRRPGPIVGWAPIWWSPGWRSVLAFLALVLLAHLTGWGGPLGEEFAR